MREKMPRRRRTGPSGIAAMKRGEIRVCAVGNAGTGPCIQHLGKKSVAGHFLPGLLLLDVGDSGRQCACSRVEFVHCVGEYLLLTRLCAFYLPGRNCRLGETGSFACIGDTPVDSGHPADDERNTFQKISTSHVTSRYHFTRTSYFYQSSICCKKCFQNPGITKKRWRRV